MSFVEKYGLGNFKTCDNHFHMKYPEKIDKSLDILNLQRKYFNLDKVQLCCMPCYDMSENYKGFYLKSKLDGVYVSAGLRHYCDERDTADGYLEQIKAAHRMGCDGIKMLEGKLKLHKTLKGKLCDEVFDKFYAYAEENRMPIVLHLGDPGFFWDINELKKYSIYEYAIANNWLVEPEDPSLEDLRAEVQAVLEKFPKLTLILAHFYFISNDIDRAEKMLNTWENLYFDLTPNAYMYSDFSKNYDKWRAFFEKHADRILYGTDTYVKACDESTVEKLHGLRPRLVRLYLEKSEEFPERTLDQEVIRPFGLDDKVLHQIYYGNFVRLYGEKPVPLNHKMIGEACGALLKEDLDELTRDNLQIIMEHFQNI